MSYDGRAVCVDKEEYSLPILLMKKIENSELKLPVII